VASAVVGGIVPVVDSSGGARGSVTYGPDDVLECEWCGCDVPPLTCNVTGFGFTYPRDEDGDVCCAACRELPPYFVPMGHA
jgi:hypothetical protein